MKLGISRRSRAVTARKCTKKYDARAKLLFCLTFWRSCRRRRRRSVLKLPFDTPSKGRLHKLSKVYGLNSVRAAMLSNMHSCAYRYNIIELIKVYTINALASSCEYLCRICSSVCFETKTVAWQAFLGTIKTDEAGRAPIMTALY